MDETELAQLHELVPFRRWQPEPAATPPPEWISTIELLLCARAAAFVGTLPSTWSATGLVQRDLRRAPRNRGTASQRHSRAR